MADGEICLIDKNVTSLSEVPLSANVRSLNLHCNRISKIEGLTTAWHLRHLDLSSNQISRIEGLESLASLRTLNLSCNLITKVEGLVGLVNLIRLNLSYNQISDLTGLLYLHGTEYKVKHLNLQCNHLNSMNQLLQCMLGLKNLKDVTLSLDGSSNPVCSTPGYREMVLQSLPQLTALDGIDRLGNHVPLLEDSPVDVPGLEDFVEFLLSSDTSVNAEKPNADAPLTTPRIDEALANFRQRIGSGGVPGPARQAPAESSNSDLDKQTHRAGDMHNELRIKKLEQQVSQLFHQTPSTSSSAATPMRKAKRDIDHTSESECDSGKENRRGGSGRRSRIPTHRGATVTAGKRLAKDARSRKTDSDQDTPTARPSKPAACARRKADPHGQVQGVEPGAAGKKGPRAMGRTPGVMTTSQTEEETYRAIIEERDQERERRWKAEQAVKKLTEQMQHLQTQASEEKDLQNMALHTTDRLKELLLKERAERAGLQERVERLEERERAAREELGQARSREDQQQRALRSLEDSISRGEALRARQQAEEMKKNQELENKAAALKREVDILRTSARQHKDKMQQLHELLASREQMHRKELESRLVPGGPEFREAVQREAVAMEERHAQQRAELQEKVAAARQQYVELEEEFRLALTIEATRFAEVKEGFDHLSVELSEHKAALAKSQQREKQTATLVQDLTAMVKEQKIRIAELVKSKKEAVSELKARTRSLEAGAEEDRRRSVQVELLRQDKAKLLSQLTAQESVIEGLRAERRIWGQELAQQGASLAQDRGRLEARIEVLSTELETMKKQNERDNDALRIKAKIVDDQTETIRKLKEALQDRDEQIRRLREENLQAQRRFQEQLEEEAAPVHELRERVEQLSSRKEELKQQLEDKEAELEEVKRAYSAMNKKWQDKGELLTRLESQVKRMKEGFDAKEKTLLEEKEKAVQAHKAVVEKLRTVDDAFRSQLETVQASHQAELFHLANEKQKQIEQANQKVLQVEEEMRQLLEETENTKRTMEEKMRRLTRVLQEF
ncbi:leucine-rich repeat and coiled-coil domain-containing protein 1 [Megalops cyprinoides]|uniref:leucine-rich repeat and coiled-coil domain-containing protein 1 n=1 Tax=Megalops cyprinoides TaxID=118141 RepID=UPI001864E20C|nr:leucine-rich repeat and coiled-coil domain-containing protein 1 [Megalops cyprinoides]